MGIPLSATSVFAVKTVSELFNLAVSDFDTKKSVHSNKVLFLTELSISRTDVKLEMVGAVAP